MTLSIQKRLLHFPLELPSQNPEDWSLEMLDLARERLLAEAESQHFHLKTLEEAILDHPQPPVGSCITRHMIETGVSHDHLYRLLSGMPESMAACYLGVAETALDHGNAELAAQAISRVLRHDPRQPRALGLLERLSGTHPAGMAQDLRRRFRLRHIRSIGRSRLKLPFLFLIDREQRHLIVCDAQRQQVCIFNLAGRFIRTIPLGTEGVTGVTLSRGSGFWVCDTPNKRLLRFGLDGKILEEFRYAQKAGTTELYTSARAFEIGSGRFVAAGEDAAGRYVLGELTRNGFLPQNAFTEKCLYINCVGDRLLLRDYYSGDIFQLDTTTWQTTLIHKFQLRQFGANLGFAFNGKAWFMITANCSLVKFTTDGYIEYRAPLKSMHKLSTVFYDIVPVTENGKDYIFVSDPSAGCIHKLEV